MPLILFSVFAAVLCALNFQDPICACFFGANASCAVLGFIDYMDHRLSVS